MILETLSTNPQSLYANLPVSSPGAHFENGNLNMGQLIQAIGGDHGVLTVKALLNIMIGELMLFFNVGKNIDRPQIIGTVELILEDFKHLKPEDFKLCFNRMKKGWYGSLYDRFDGQIIFNCLNQFDQERATEIESLWQKANAQLKKQEAQPMLMIDPETSIAKNEVFRRNIEKLKKDSEDRKKAKLLADTDANEAKNYKGPVYQMHQRWIAQFDTLWKRQGYPSNRLIKRYGKVKNPKYFPGSDEPKKVFRKMDINAFLVHKQWQYNEYINRKNKS